MKKAYGVLLLVGVFVLAVTGISIANFNISRDINVVSRESGSGTRGAFVELLGIEETLPNGNRVDRTTIEAIIANQTDVVIASVGNNPYAIGYISLGSLNDRVKALQIDEVEPSQENIMSGEYKVARPFNIAVKDEPTGVVKDFMDYIMSANGQEMVAEGYIAVVTDAEKFSTTRPIGRVVVGGSTSVAPLMEQLAEAYMRLNPNADVEIQATGSGAGMIGAIEGALDIGMASRAMSSAEKNQLNGTVIAQDGIVIIVNHDNPLDSLTAEQVRDIYVGDLTSWSL